MFDMNDLIVNDELMGPDMNSSRRAGARKKNYSRVTPQSKKNENLGFQISQISYDGSMHIQTSILVNEELFENIDKLNLDLGWNDEQINQKTPQELKQHYIDQLEQPKNENKQKCCLF